MRPVSQVFDQVIGMAVEFGVATPCIGETWPGESEACWNEVHLYTKKAKELFDAGDGFSNTARNLMAGYIIECVERDYSVTVPRNRARQIAQSLLLIDQGG
jgi:hypothetical protein